MNKFYFLLITVFLCAPLYGQSQRPVVPWEKGLSAAKDLKIMLITIGPGDLLTDWWGHVGIAVQDTTYKITRVYNFGLFSFEEGFIERFAMGRLIFWSGDASLESIINRYARVNRTINYQELDLKDIKKLELAQKLSFYILPENSHYLYDHYYENCATRIRDLVNEAVDGSFKTFTEHPGRLTFREHTLCQTAHAPLMQWLLMFLMNDTIDKQVNQWDEMFLPGELAKYISLFTLENQTGIKKSIVLNSGVLYASNRELIPEIPDHWPVWTIISGVAIALLALFLSYWNQVIFKIFATLIAFFTGFIGSVLFLMSSFTDHIVTYGNENLFLANPVSLLVFFISLAAIIRPSKRKIQLLQKGWLVIAIISVVLLVLKLFPLFDQDNLMIISVLLPVNIGISIAFFNLNKT